MVARLLGAVPPMLCCETVRELRHGFRASVYGVARRRKHRTGTS
jgi:hypothetical protein